jgi:hypothetical protein
MTAFYPGAGTDLTPVVLFPEIKTWYYMDSQPRSEYGDTVILYRPKFLNQLDQSMQQCGFKMKEVENHFLTYFSSETGQTIYYETSTNFPTSWDPIKHEGSTLVLCGYDMESSGPIPPYFFSSYSHILTNNLTVDDLWKKNILPTHTLSRMNYPTDKSYEYWNPEIETAENIRKYVSIERDIKWTSNESL